MKLKAYGWDDEDYDESQVVWAATPGKAKALLASEHDREFTEMRVYRVPWADKIWRSQNNTSKRTFKSWLVAVLFKLWDTCSE